MQQCFISNKVWRLVDDVHVKKEEGTYTGSCPFKLVVGGLLPVFIKLNELKLKLCGCSSLDQWAQIVRFSVIIFANGSRRKLFKFHK
jgi:hypothetical protein